MACTNPNRVSWMSGSVNVPGGPQSPDEGGTLLQNACTPGNMTYPTIPFVWAEYFRLRYCQPSY